MKPELIAFLLGLGTRLHVRLIGYLPLSELAILIATPFLLRQLTAPACRKPLRLLMPLAGLWMANTIASDLFNQTEWSLAARGIARVVVFLCCIPFCSWFISTRTREKLIWFFTGCIPSFVLSAYVLRGGVHEGRALSTGVMEITWETHWCGLPYVIALIIMLVYYKKNALRCYLAGVLAGGLNVFMGARSIGATMVMAVGACISRNLVSYRHAVGEKLLRRLTLAGTLPAIVLLAVFSVVTLEGYRRAAETGVLGERARLKYLNQSRGKYGLLVTGRADAFAGFIAIWESPIIGYGSWPLDKQGFYLRMCEIFELRPEKKHYSRGYPMIPSHSHLAQAWVQNGLFGGVFWTYSLYLLGLSFFRPMVHEKELRLWACAVAMNTAWAVLFSPIGDRLTTALVLAVLVREMSPLPASLSRGATTVRIRHTSYPLPPLVQDRIGA